MLPDQYTIKETYIKTHDGHELYVQCWGSKSAKQDIIYLHGGPGSGCNDKAKRLFDPARHRVIFFDQRGCGKSKPYGSLDNNDTENQIKDINIIAENFVISSFYITGGSWGSCLALAYAIQHADKIKGMVLRGIFTGRQREIDFLDKGYFRDFFPEVWQTFLNSVPEDFQKDPRAYHLPRILGDDSDALKKSAHAYAVLEGSLVSLDDRQIVESFDDFDPVPTTIECHYLANNCFLPEAHIINNAKSLTMPVHLVQGRYDAICPPTTAYELHKILPNSTLTWTVAGHSGNDRANVEAVKAIFAALIS